MRSELPIQLSIGVQSVPMCPKGHRLPPRIPAAPLGLLPVSGDRPLAGPQNPQYLSHLTPRGRVVLSIYFEDTRRERPRGEKAVGHLSCPPRVRVIMDCSPRFRPLLAH
jgi:hypothetical protein